MSILRSIKKAIHKKGLLGAIAKNAINQLNKWKAHDSTLSELEIAQNIFTLRYTKGSFSNQEKQKILRYFESEFEFQSLMDFCLASLDIEGNINPEDGDAFNKTAELLEDILNDLGYHKEKSNHQEMFNRLGFSSSRVNSFSVQWFEKIM